MRGTVTLLGLLAALLFALAAFLQQSAARTMPRQGHTVLTGIYALMRRLVVHRVWLIGWLVNLAAFGVQATALHLGSVAAVQPLLATQLLFAVVLSSVERSVWPSASDWGAGISICLGLSMLVVVGGTTLEAVERRDRVELATVAAAGLAFLLAAAASRVSGGGRVVALGGAAGVCFAMSSVFIKLTAEDLLDRGVGYTARDWVGYALAVSTLAGLVLQQAAFANGPLPWTVATTNSVNSVASYAVGVLAFPAAVGLSAGALAGVVGAGLLIFVGAIGLAKSSSASLWLQRADGHGDVDAPMLGTH
jgi:hypothetical protein